MKISREAKIGIVATLTLAIFIWGLNFLKGQNILSSTNSFYAKYNNVEGLKESAFVTLHGIKVGLVASIEIDKHKQNNVVVKLLVDKEVNLPIDTKAQLYSSDLLGTKAIKLVMGNQGNFLQNNDSIAAGYKPGITDKMDELVVSVEDIIGNIDTVSQSLTELFNNTTNQELQNTISNLSGVSDNMNHLTAKNGELTKTITNLNSITANVEKHNATISRILTNLETVSDSISRIKLAQTIDSAFIAINQAQYLLNNINQGQGTLGQLAQNDTLYQHIANTTESLNLLLMDLKEHPKRYVHFSLFGKKDKP
ncbi:MAG: MCE family protein [Bacteroidetes bacterium]|jgi:phospholipid/cholesterol/gamma-HCH transport system substrate-binding protein|nr:MCE family protein [Bacteroidota bacterium]